MQTEALLELPPGFLFKNSPQRDPAFCLPVTCINKATMRTSGVNMRVGACLRNVLPSLAVFEGIVVPLHSADLLPTYVILQRFASRGRALTMTEAVIS